jgi:D-alanyl-D-alanine carboxypeptidase (penicillin-binding protein 5/6)
LKKGDVAGKAVYKLNDNEIGSVDILYGEDMEKALFKDYFLKALGYLFL